MESDEVSDVGSDRANDLSSSESFRIAASPAEGGRVPAWAEAEDVEHDSSAEGSFHRVNV